MEKKNIHSGHRQRLRRQFLRTGGQYMADHQLLELALFYALPRRDVNPLAHRLLDRFGSLAGVFDAPPDALLAVDGVSEGAVALLQLLRQLMDWSPRLAAGTDTPEELDRYVRSLFRSDRQHICLLALDGEGIVQAVERLEGLGNVCPRLDVKSVVTAAARLRPESVALAVPRQGPWELPTAEDLEDALRCERVLAALDVGLLDVLLCSDEELVSLRRMRLLH
jgi:DNA repair protein RadC